MVRYSSHDLNSELIVQGLTFMFPKFFRFEVIKEYYKKGFPKSRVDEFYTSAKYDPYSDIFLTGSSPCYMYRIWARAMALVYGESWKGWKREFLPKTSNVPINT